MIARPALAAMPVLPALAPIAAGALPAVVSVESIDPMKHPVHPGMEPAAAHSERADTSTLIAPPPRAEQALGAGFLISPHGYIVTNHHVIAGASEIRVTMHDGRVYPAKLIGADPKADLAVLKIHTGQTLPFLKFGDSGKLVDGDWVMAIGNPFGLSFSVSAGIVSALHRDIRSGPFDNYIQTDAAINRGNSGGPLLNQKGEVIGIDTAIYSPAGGSVGIGFAIPSSMIQPVAAALRAHGKMTRGWAGLRVEHMTREMAAAWKLDPAKSPENGPAKDTVKGIVVAGVAANGPSARRLRPGDVIMRINGREIADTHSFKVAIGEIAAGDQARVAYWRDGALRHAALTIAVAPREAKPGKPGTPKLSPLEITSLGMSVITHPEAAGLIVAGVTKGGPAAKAGVHANTVIEAVGPDFVTTPAELQKALERQLAAKPGFVALLIGRPQGISWVPVKLAAPGSAMSGSPASGSPASGSPASGLPAPHADKETSRPS
jgi:serine protease Do